MAKKKVNEENQVEVVDDSREVDDNAKVSKFKKARYNKKVRIIVILVLMVIVAMMFYFFEKARIALVIAFLFLAGALGLEVTENDWDLGKLWETKSFEQSKLDRDESGNILFDKFGEITTDQTKGKEADEYNCDDFDNKPEAQNFFEKVGGTDNDLNRLDGDKDGEACEVLPMN